MNCIKKLIITNCTDLEECKEDEVYVEGLCLARSALGEVCVGNAQCTGGSICIEKICKCPENTVPRGKICQADIQSKQLFLFHEYKN